MGKPSLTEAVGYLTEAGLRTDRGYPGGVMPHLTGVVAAVNLRNATNTAVTYVAAICSPQRLGAAACEDAAEKAAMAWAGAGAEYRYGSYDFDGQSAMHILEVLGTWEDPVATEGETTEETTEESTGETTE